jgi:hypothetical protein
MVIDQQLQMLVYYHQCSDCCGFSRISGILKTMQEKRENKSFRRDFTPYWNEFKKWPSAQRGMR